MIHIVLLIGREVGWEEADVFEDREHLAFKKWALPGTSTNLVQ